MATQPEEPQSQPLRPIGDHVQATPAAQGSQQAAQQAAQGSQQAKMVSGLPRGNSYWMQLDEPTKATWAREHHLTAQDYVALTADMARSLGVTLEPEPFVIAADEDLRRLRTATAAPSTTTTTEPLSTLQSMAAREIVERMVSEEGALAPIERVRLMQQRRHVRDRIETSVTLMAALTVGFALSMIWGYASHALSGLASLYGLLLLLGLAYVLQRAQESKRLSAQLAILRHPQTANTSANAPHDATSPVASTITAAQRDELAQLLRNIQARWPSRTPDTPADEQ